jgi:ribosomal-protein-alanine N-acetyltransferase
MPEPYTLDLPRITTERTILRMAEPGDVPAILRYQTENREHLAASRPRVTDDFYTDEFWQAQVHASRAEFRNDRSLRLFVFDRAEPGRVIGNVNFTQIQRGPAQFCFLGYGLDRAKEGQGLMREALQAAIRYAFEEMNLHRVMANHAPWNTRSGGLLRRLGFVVEGYARDYLYLDGQWVDHVLTSLTNPGWRER